MLQNLTKSYMMFVNHYTIQQVWTAYFCLSGRQTEMELKLEEFETYEKNL